MNTKTIDQAKNADLRGSWQALHRAAQRARELAAQTGTELVINRNGVIEHIKLLPGDTGHQMQESPAPSRAHPAGTNLDGLRAPQLDRGTA